MVSASGRYVIVFNGEIYNHLENRKQIQDLDCGFPWRGHSDTETLLAGFDKWGIEETLRRSLGMLALAVWDRERRTLVLARDRMGEKPLYYGYIGHTLAFGSELKALRQAPGFSAEMDRGALALLLRHGYIPGPYTIFKGVAKLPPAAWAEFSTDAVRQRVWPEPNIYWSAKEAAFSGVANPLMFASDAEAVESLELMLRRSVADQTIADVPVGAFLSGGIDSSTVVALMQAQTSRAAKTFTIGFNEAGFNEAIFAKEVARHLGTDHTELYVSPKEVLSVIPKLPEIYCEPFADPTQIPNFLIAKLARMDVKVSLSGDGGDELFGGYSRYSLAVRVWRKVGRWPLSLRRAVASSIFALPPAVWEKLYGLAAFSIPKRLSKQAFSDKLYKAAELLCCDNRSSLYWHFMSHWMPENAVLQVVEPRTEFWGNACATLQFTEQMMLLDTITYLPDDILVKVDRAAMAVGLETRVPMLDHRLYEYVWRLPLQYKVRDGSGKWLLRQVLYKYLPRKLVDRPKAGFSVPIDSWLRGPLRDWAEDLLDESHLRADGYFNPAPIRRRWHEHLSGTRKWHYHLWNVLMFQAWHAAYKSERSANI